MIVFNREIECKWIDTQAGYPRLYVQPVLFAFSKLQNWLDSSPSLRIRGFVPTSLFGRASICGGLTEDVSDNGG